MIIILAYLLSKNMSKKARKEGNRVACLIKANKAEFYISDVDLGDNPDHVMVAVQNIKRTLGKMRSAFMVISAGIKFLTVVAYVPPELEDRISSKEWLNESLLGIREGKETIGENYTQIVIKTDAPFKLKDMVRGNGFAFLSKHGLMEEESSEEFIGFDDFDL